MYVCVCACMYVCVCVFLLCAFVAKLSDWTPLEMCLCVSVCLSVSMLVGCVLACCFLLCLLNVASVCVCILTVPCLPYFIFLKRNRNVKHQKTGRTNRERRESKNLLFDELESEYTQEEIWWRATSNTKLEALIGKTINGKLQNITFEDSFVHALIAGTTGSGKSALLHTIILSLALKYSPEELELYLLDFKEGLEFNAYKNLPHAKLVSIKSDRELGTELSHPVN